MADTVITVLILILLFIGLPVFLLRVIDRKRIGRARQRQTSASDSAERETHERRILAPDWVCVERHLRRPPPRPLRDLYADRRLVTQRDLEYDNDRRISTFEPLDEEAMADASQALGFDAVVIATTDFGDSIYLQPGAGEANVVRVAYHDGGDINVFAESMEGMMDILKRRHS
jgi:hypothetical protein